MNHETVTAQMSELFFSLAPLTINPALPHSSALAEYTWDSCSFILNEARDRPHKWVGYFPPLAPFTINPALSHSSALADYTWDSCSFILNEVRDTPQNRWVIFSPLALLTINSGPIIQPEGF
jgi:hypothetical protein